VTITALAHERSGIAEVESLMRWLEGLKDLAREVGRSDETAVRRRIASIETRIQAMRMSGLRFLTKQLRGEPLGSETSVNKLIRAQLEVELGDFAVDLQGAAGSLVAGAEAVADGGRWQRMALSWPEVVIGGGTPNIQKNIIAERILGLPKD